MDYTQLGITPINEQNPAGEDVKYDDVFEHLEKELAKLTSPSSSGEIDWQEVTQLSYDILDKKSKNLLVAVYFSYALYRLRGIDGLDDGVKVIADLLENYWETLYPPKKRLKGRINAIEWWLGRISKDLEAIDEKVIQSEQKERLIQNLKKIDDFLNNALEEAPLFYKLINLLDAKLVTTESTLHDEVSEEEGVTQTPSTQAEAPTQTQNVSSNVEEDFKVTVDTLNLLIGKMIETKDYRAELFVANRAFTWLDIESLPASEKNITMLPPPDSQEVELLHTLYKDENYEALLFSAESRISTYLFWLDLHHYVAESLRHLAQDEAADVVCEQVQYFIKKLPNLQNLSFSDATPFASKATKQWLKPKVVTSASTQTLKTEAQDVEENNIDALVMKMHACSSVEEEVFYNIKICRFLIEHPNDVLIYTYLEKLLDTIKAYTTIKWNPTIALESYQVGVECLNVLDNASDSTLLNTLLKKIALLKPSLVEEIG